MGKFDRILNDNGSFTSAAVAAEEKVVAEKKSREVQILEKTKVILSSKNMTELEKEGALGALNLTKEDLKSGKFPEINKFLEHTAKKRKEKLGHKDEPVKEPAKPATKPKKTNDSDL